MSIDASRRFYEALRLQFVIGAADIERVVAWSRRLLEAEREAGDGGLDPWAAHAARMKRLEQDLDARPRTAPATPLDRVTAELCRVEADLWVAGQRGAAVDAALPARRLQLAKQGHDQARAAFEQGAELEPVYQASIRWLEAARDQDEGGYGKALEAHLDRVHRLHGLARTRATKGGLRRRSDLPTAELFRWEAEVYLHDARGGEHDRRRKAFLDHWVEQATNAHDLLSTELRQGQADVERVAVGSLRLLDAERARGPALNACEAHLSRVQRLEKELRKLEDAGLGLSLGAVEWFREDAERKVARARAGP